MEKKLVSFVASALLVSSAMAAPNIATDGTGDYLVAPMFSTIEGYETKLKLMNTDNEHAYLVRGVVRRYGDSAELVDFTIMLSPGDVWEGKIVDDKIISTDDSNWRSNLNELITKKCIEQNLSDQECKRGYVEFYVLAELNNAKPEVAAAFKKSNYSAAYQTTTVNVTSIDKPQLKSLFVAALGAENAQEGIERTADTTYVVDPSQINNDAIGGYVTLSSVKSDTLYTTLPLFAFEHTRETGQSLQAQGFAPGEVSRPENYFGSLSAIDDILNLIRYKYASIPFNLENGDAQMVFTFILDHYEGDQIRSFKQNFRNMTEKYPIQNKCLKGQALIDYINEKYKDLQDPTISPYYPPKCEIKETSYTFTMKNEVANLQISEQLKYETQKKYTRIITYTAKDNIRKKVPEPLQWNDVNLTDYTSGMYQVHNIQNKPIYGQAQYGGNLKAAYIPTYFEIRKIGGKEFLTWNYAIMNK